MSLSPSPFSSRSPSRGAGLLAAILWLAACGNSDSSPDDPGAAGANQGGAGAATAGASGASGGPGGTAGGAAGGAAGGTAGGASGGGIGGGAGVSGGASGGASGGTSGGASGGGAACSPAPTGKLPAAVEAVLMAKCQTCHQDPPLHGAPFPLLKYEDFQKPFFDNLLVWQEAAMQIEPKGSPGMPFGNAPQLTSDEHATLQGWFAACTPSAP